MTTYAKLVAALFPNVTESIQNATETVVNTTTSVASQMMNVTLEMLENINGTGNSTQPHGGIPLGVDMPGGDSSNVVRDFAITAGALVAVGLVAAVAWYYKKGDFCTNDLVEGFGRVSATDDSPRQKATAHGYKPLSSSSSEKKKEKAARKAEARLIQQNSDTYVAPDAVSLVERHEADKRDIVGVNSMRM
jgi:hypothetical protein